MAQRFIGFQPSSNDVIRLTRQLRMGHIARPSIDHMADRIEGVLRQDLGVPVDGGPFCDWRLLANGARLIVEILTADRNCQQSLSLYATLLVHDIDWIAGAGRRALIALLDPGLRENVMASVRHSVTRSVLNSVNGECRFNLP